MMRSFLVFIGFILFFLGQSVAAQSPLEGAWTGGFWLEGNWVTVDVRFNSQMEKLSGTADFVPPSYSGSVRARGINLNAVKSDSEKIE